jgi:ceramide glucosyltransferase
LPLFWLVFLPAVAYQVLAVWAALRHLHRRHSQASRRAPGFYPGISVLKALRGLDPNTRDAFLSQIQQDYPEFEVLFGAADEADPAAQEVLRLQREFPEAPIRLIIGAESAANGKVGVLMELAKHARYPVWVVNDSDIKVGSTYLREVIAPLADSEAGVITCLYRAKAHTLAAAWEALGIAIDFMPSTLVAPLVGVREFGLGATLAFRSADLEQAGGFAAIAGYLADDYQLARRLTSLGKRAVLSTYTVETSLGDATWRGVWQHQIRWARTIRASKGKGYAGLPLTQAGIWIIIALVCGAWIPAAVLAAIRVISAFVTARLVLDARKLVPFLWLAPVWDLYAFAVWAASYGGRSVRWRDRRVTIDSQGRIQRIVTCERSPK